MKYYIIGIFALLLVGCKSSQAVATKVAEGKAEESSDVAKVIKAHDANSYDFKTLYIKSSARYQDASQSQNVTAEIRIEKDKQILVSIRFLGITMAKALITPNQVRYYEKLNGSYFDGDFTALSKWLGTELDYQKVQNLLFGKALDNLEEGRYDFSIQDALYQLRETSDKNTQKTYFFEADNHLVKKQIIAQASQQRSLEVNYPAHNKYDQAILPGKILIDALQPKGKTSINITYNSVSFNEELSFPYSVPEGYERIFID